MPELRAERIANDPLWRAMNPKIRAYPRHPTTIMTRFRSTEAGGSLATALCAQPPNRGAYLRTAVPAGGCSIQALQRGARRVTSHVAKGDPIMRPITFAAIAAACWLGSCAGPRPMLSVRQCNSSYTTEKDPTKFLEGYREYDRCARHVDAENEKRGMQDIAAYRMLLGVGDSLQAPGDAMLNQPRPTLSAPPPPLPQSAGPSPSNLDEHYLPPPITGPAYCTSTPLSQTMACPH
jgi:hypothetical protein